MGCEALNPNIHYVCDWGWVNTTVKFTFDAMGAIKRLNCAVPFLPGVEDGALISILLHPILTDEASTNEYVLRSKQFLGKSIGPLGELSTHQIMLRYHLSSRSCGCNPLIQLSQKQCDSCGVCGGSNATIDCNGDCFGNAYKDSRGLCSRGLTLVDPLASGGELYFDLESDFIGLLRMLTVLVAFGCLGCGFSLYIFCIRVIVHLSERTSGTQPDPDPQTPSRVRRIHPTNPSGLTSEQINVIGEFLFERSSLSGTECPICLAAINEGETCRRLPFPCDHIFHREVSSTLF